MSATFTLLPSIAETIDRAMPNADVMELEAKLGPYIHGTHFPKVPLEGDWFAILLRLHKIVGETSWGMANPGKAHPIVSAILPGIIQENGLPTMRDLMRSKTFCHILHHSGQYYKSIASSGLLDGTFPMEPFSHKEDIDLEPLLRTAQQPKLPPNAVQVKPTNVEKERELKQNKERRMMEDRQMLQRKAAQLREANSASARNKLIQQEIPMATKPAQRPSGLTPRTVAARPGKPAQRVASARPAQRVASARPAQRVASARPTQRVASAIPRGGAVIIETEPARVGKPAVTTVTAVTATPTKKPDLLSRLRRFGKKSAEKHAAQTDAAASNAGVAATSNAGVAATAGQSDPKELIVMVDRSNVASTSGQPPVAFSVETVSSTVRPLYPLLNMATVPGRILDDEINLDGSPLDDIIGTEPIVETVTKKKSRRDRPGN